MWAKSPGLLTCLSAIGLLVTLSTCSVTSRLTRKLPQGNAVGEQTQNSGEGTTHLHLGQVFLYTADILLGDEPAVLLTARPEEMDEELELLEARVNFLIRRRDDTGVNGAPGSLCTDRWPPKDFGPNVPLEGLEIDPRDQFAVNFFVRPKREGDWSASGLILTYKQGRRTFQQTTTADTWNLLTRDSEKELPSGQTCLPVPTIWFGDTDTGEPFRCRDPKDSGDFVPCEDEGD